MGKTTARRSLEPSIALTDMDEYSPTPTTAMLTAAMIKECLLDVAGSLDKRGVSATINLVGGAAIALAHYDRPPTTDVDTFLHPAEEVLAEARRVAGKRHLRPDWLNTAAAQFVPPDSPPFITLFNSGRVTVTVAPPDILLAMKLRACRPNKDFFDIAYLLRECDVRSVDEAIAHMKRFSPEEEIPPNRLSMVERALEAVDIPTEPPIHLEAAIPRQPPTTCQSWVLREDGRCSRPTGHSGDCATH